MKRNATRNPENPVRRYGSEHPVLAQASRSWSSAITLLAFACLVVTAWAGLTVSVESPVVLCCGSGEQPISATFSGEGTVWVEISGDGTTQREYGTGTATATVYVDTSSWNRTILYSVHASDGSSADLTVHVVGITELSCDEGTGPFCAPATLHFTAVSQPVDSGSVCAVVWGPQDSSDTLVAEMTFDPEEKSTEVVSAAIGYSTAYFTITIHKLKITVLDASNTPVLDGGQYPKECCTVWNVSVRGGSPPYSISASRNPPVPGQNPCAIVVNPASIPDEGGHSEVMFPTGLGPTTALAIEVTDAVGCGAMRTITFQPVPRTYSVCGTLRWGPWERAGNTSVTANYPGQLLQAEAHVVQPYFDAHPIIAEACELVGGVCQNPKVQGAIAVIQFLNTLAQELGGVVGAEDLQVQVSYITGVKARWVNDRAGVFYKVEYCDKTVTYHGYRCNSNPITRVASVNQPVHVTVRMWYVGAEDPPPPQDDKPTGDGVKACPCDGTHHPF